MGLEQLRRIKLWHVEHRAEHPLEYHLFDAVLTLWLAGWVGLLPAFLFCPPALLLCPAAAFAPAAYVGWRLRAHRARRLRCDWAALAPG